MEPASTPKKPSKEQVEALNDLLIHFRQDRLDEMACRPLLEFGKALGYTWSSSFISEQLRINKDDLQLTLEALLGIMEPVHEEPNPNPLQTSQRSRSLQKSPNELFREEFFNEIAQRVITSDTSPIGVFS